MPPRPAWRRLWDFGFFAGSLLIAAIGMPLVLIYTITVYWTFRGKVRVERHGH